MTVPRQLLELASSPHGHIRLSRGASMLQHGRLNMDGCVLPVSGFAKPQTLREQEQKVAKQKHKLVQWHQALMLHKSDACWAHSSEATI